LVVYRRPHIQPEAFIIIQAKQREHPINDAKCWSNGDVKPLWDRDFCKETWPVSALTLKV
jgi:hypothetical protein